MRKQKKTHDNWSVVTKIIHCITYKYIKDIFWAAIGIYIYRVNLKVVVMLVSLLRMENIGGNQECKYRMGSGVLKTLYYEYSQIKLFRAEYPNFL